MAHYVAVTKQQATNAFNKRLAAEDAGATAKLHDCKARELHDADLFCGLIC